MTKILFFARLREALGTNQIEMQLDKPVSLIELRLAIIEQNPAWEIELMKQNLLVAINKQHAQFESLVNPGDEVAFFTPVTGG
jgi:molybdopterin synthase sulfur carrier subunit